MPKFFQLSLPSTRVGHIFLFVHIKIQSNYNELFKKSNFSKTSFCIAQNLVALMYWGIKKWPDPNFCYSLKVPHGYGLYHKKMVLIGLKMASPEQFFCFQWFRGQNRVTPVQPPMGVGGQNPFGSEIPLGYLAYGQKMVGKLNFASDGFATVESQTPR